MTDEIEVRREEVSFASHGMDVRVFGDVWYDASGLAPRGTVQIAHGMSEYVRRYDDFARFLVGRGFAVCGIDHVGHGRSVASRADLGHMDPKRGRDALVEDAHELRKLVQARFGADVPYFLFGHSMGSFVVRAYVTQHGEGLAGAIVCGTGHVPPLTSSAGNLLARAICALHGNHAKSELLHSLADGAYGKAIQNPRTDLDWLSFDEANVDAYIADPDCGFMFTAGGYATLTALTAEVCSPKSAARIPKNLPLLYIAGAEDPVGSNGAGVRTAAGLARTAGVADVTEHIYAGMRHEILNERGHEAVYADVAEWLENVTRGLMSHHS